LTGNHVNATVSRMARRTRCADGGYVYHVLNRAVGRATLFNKAADYAAFEKVLRQAWERTAMRLLAYVVLPNHWHLVVWPQHDGDLSIYAQWLTVTHVRRWHAHHHTGAPDRCTRVGLSPSRFKKTTISIRCAAMSNAIRCARSWRDERKSGGGQTRIPLWSGCSRTIPPFGGAWRWQIL
jgi:REP element-mobilizing transposase RayT